MNPPKKKKTKKERQEITEEEMRKVTHFFLCVSGLADFVQQLCVEVLVVGGSLGHGALQGGDLLLGSAQTLLKSLHLAALFHPLSVHRLQHSQQLQVTFTCGD